MTVYVTSDDERALVEITPDVKASLSVGRHVIYRYGCTMNVNVTKSGGCVNSVLLICIINSCRKILNKFSFYNHRACFALIHTCI